MSWHHCDAPWRAASRLRCADAGFKQQQETARAAQKELDEKVEAVRATLRDQGGSADGFGGPGVDGDARMDFDDDNKMRKSGRMKGRHIAPGGKHSARLS